MAERLPFGEVRPQARPINSFIQPGRVDTAAATSPSLMGRPSGVTFQQQGSAGNVQGFNQYEQLAKALSPFSSALMETMSIGIKTYVSDAIQGGYYDELKNQQARATLNLQNQQEQGAINAGTAISQLQKRDPEAAYVLNESNPWRLVGRRRALAQLAGGDISGALMDDLLVNKGQLAGLQPGDSRLLQRKQQLAQQVLSKYGLTGQEPEAQAYLVPKLNQAWDKYSERHRTLFSQQLKANTMANGAAALGRMMEGFATNGIAFNGQVIQLNDPMFPRLAGAFLTQELDKQLAMVGGVDRAEAVKQIREQLVGTYGQQPILGQALSFVQGGNPADSNRPTWGASNPLDMLELQNRGNGARLLQYEQGQKQVEQNLDGLWMSSGGPGSMLPTDPGYPAALLAFRNQAAQMGYRDIDSYMKNRISSLEAVTQDVYGSNPLDSADFLDEIESLPRSAFGSSDGVRALKNRARQIYRADPAGYKAALDAINQRADQAEKTTPGLQQEIDRALLQDLNLPAIKPLVDKAKGGGGGSAFAAALQGNAGAVAAIGALGNAEVQAFSIRVNNLFLRNAEAKIDKWMAERPGVALTSSVRNVLINEAIAETRKSQEYAAAYEQLTRKKPGEVGDKKVGDKKVGDKPGPEVRGVPKAAANGLPDTTVKRYQQQPVMEGQWLRQELVSVGTGKPVSAELYRLANRAGTSTNRYLYEQLRFYPQLDPGGGIRRYLREEVKKQQQAQKVSAANYSAVVGVSLFNPMAPGSWLMGMLTPPAAAATLDSQPRYGYGEKWAEGPAVPASHAETGAGYTVPGATDAHGRPVVLNRHAMNAYAAMVRDSGGVVKWGDIASAQRSPGKNKSVGGVSGSPHLGGGAVDTHGDSNAWIRKNGARYGWVPHDYSGTHGGHFEFRGPTK